MFIQELRNSLLRLRTLLNANQRCLAVCIVEGNEAVVAASRDLTIVKDLTSIDAFCEWLACGNSVNNVVVLVRVAEWSTAVECSDIAIVPLAYSVKVVKWKLDPSYVNSTLDLEYFTVCFSLAR